MPGIHQTWTFETHRGHVFDALREGPRICQWWAKDATTDPCEDGKWALTFDTPEGEHVQEGTYKTYVHYRELGFPWRTPKGTTQVHIRLEPRGPHTLLHLTHTGFSEEAPEVYKEVLDAWSFYFDNLASHLADGPDLREGREPVTMATKPEEKKEPEIDGMVGSAITGETATEAKAKEAEAPKEDEAKADAKSEGAAKGGAAEKPAEKSAEEASQAPTA